MEEENQVYDAAIIGTGPAGISAAITLKIRNKNIILFGSKSLSNKLEKAHQILNYPGFPSISGQELAEKFQKHLASLDIKITEENITQIYPMGDTFSLLSKTNKIYDAKNVIISSGVNFGKPYEGEEEFLGRGVSYCATCDAPFYKGKSCVIIAQTPSEEKEAEYMAQICSKVIYVPLYKEEPVLPDSIQIIRDTPLKIEGDSKAKRLIFKNQNLEADGFFILRESVSPKQILSGLEMDGTHIKVNRLMETNISGCFACGDITGLPYQYIKAAGEGNIAALSAVSR